MNTIVYRYGLHAPHENADLVWQQIRAAHEYRKLLTEIERERRAAVRGAEMPHGVDAAIRAVAEAKVEAVEAHKAVAKHRARSRKRDEPAELRARLKVARDAEREAVRALRAIRAGLRSVCSECTRSGIGDDPCEHASNAAVEMRNALDAIGERAKVLAKSAYENSGAYWGQRALVDEAAGDSFGELSLYDGHGEPNDPRFPRWTGDGSVGLQIMGGLSAAAAIGCGDTRLRLRGPDPRAWQGDRPDGRASCANRRRYGSTAELSLRVGSDGRDPIWARWVCDMDRPLPSGAIITWVTVHVRQRGPHSEWWLCLTVKVPGETWAKDGGDAPRKGGDVAVDLGWRVEGDSLRVAGWADERGEGAALRLDAATLRLLRSPATLQGQQDDEFNGARLALRWWLTCEDEARPAGDREQNLRGECPDWLREAIAEMAAWKNPGRLVRVWQHWHDNRFAGDERVFGMLTAWRRRAHDQWSAESLNRLQSLRRRREIYRVFAANLARDYETVILEDFDLREIARREKLAESAENEVSRSNRQLACVSELRAAIIGACNSRGRTVRSMAAADTTRTCPSCGLVADRDAAASIQLVCECGATWDQDVEGAAPVLLARWRERPGDAKIPTGARKPQSDRESEEKGETRWQRVARLRAQKEARMQTAREAAAKVAE